MNFTDINSVLSLQLSLYEDYILHSLDFYLNRRKFAQEHCWEAQRYTYDVTLPTDSLDKNITSPEIAMPLDQLTVEQQTINGRLTQTNIASLKNATNYWETEETETLMSESLTLNNNPTNNSEHNFYQVKKIS